MKQKFIDAHMKAAEVYAELSSARRLQVGCVIVKNDTIIGIGYNGMPSGWDNNCEEETFIEEFVYVGKEKETYTKQILKTKPEVMHAESNALAKVARSTNSTENADIFVTHAPCLECAKLIHQAGIKKLYYKNTYKTEEGLAFLKVCGVEVINVKGDNNE